jgi:hypothetical protein
MGGHAFAHEPIVIIVIEWLTLRCNSIPRAAQPLQLVGVAIV